MLVVMVSIFCCIVPVSAGDNDWARELARQAGERTRSLIQFSNEMKALDAANNLQKITTFQPGAPTSQQLTQNLQDWNILQLQWNQQQKISALNSMNNLVNVHAVSVPVFTESWQMQQDLKQTQQQLNLQMQQFKLQDQQLQQDLKQTQQQLNLQMQQFKLQDQQLQQQLKQQMQELKMQNQLSSAQLSSLMPSHLMNPASSFGSNSFNQPYVSLNDPFSQNSLTSNNLNNNFNSFDTFNNFNQPYGSFNDPFNQYQLNNLNNLNNFNSNNFNNFNNYGTSGLRRF